MSERVRVFIYHECADEREIRSAYEEVSSRLSTVEGMLSNELVAAVHDPCGYVIVSEWADLAAFDRWEQSPQHRRDTAPLRPFRDTRMAVPFAIYQVKASY